MLFRGEGGEEEKLDGKTHTKREKDQEYYIRLILQVVSSIDYFIPPPAKKIKFGFLGTYS